METQQVETWGTTRRGNGANSSMATTLCCFDMGCVHLLILSPNLRVQNAYNKDTIKMAQEPILLFLNGSLENINN